MRRITALLLFSTLAYAQTSGLPAPSVLGSPAGSPGAIQYNNGGVIGGLSLGTNLSVTAGVINSAASGTALPSTVAGVATTGTTARAQTYSDISAIQGTSPDTTQIDGTLKTGSGVDPSLPTAGHWLFALVPFSGVYHWGISEDGAAFRQIPTVSSAPSMIDLGWAESQDTAGTWSYFYGQGAPNIGSNPSTNMTNAPDAATYIPGDTALKGVEYYVQYNDCNKAKSSGSGGGGFPLQIQLYDATTSSLVTGTLASFAADVNFAHTPYIANPNVTLPAGHSITMQISLSGAGTGNCNLHAHAQIFY